MRERKKKCRFHGLESCVMPGDLQKHELSQDNKLCYVV